MVIKPGPLGKTAGGSHRCLLLYPERSFWGPRLFQWQFKLHASLKEPQRSSSLNLGDEVVMGTTAAALPGAPADSFHHPEPAAALTTSPDLIIFLDAGD